MNAVNLQAEQPGSCVSQQEALTGIWQSMWGTRAHLGRRIWRDGAWTIKYSHRNIPTPKAPPAYPVAVRIFDNDLTRWLVIDLDTKHAPTRNVTDIADKIDQLITAAGGHAIIDRSPTTKGMHLLVPLAQPATQPQIQRILQGLSLRFGAAVDPNPIHNTATGCITLPGSVDKGGQHRQLLTAAADVLVAVTDRAAPDFLSNLTTALPAPPPVKAALAEPAFEVRVPARRTDTVALRFAVTGVYPTSRYASRSEARQGALAAAHRAGYSLTEIKQLVATGQWKGLADSYAAARPRGGTDIDKLIDTEWGKATAWTLMQGASAGDTITRRTLRAAAHALDQEWAAATDEFTRSRTAALKAMVVAAAMTGSLEVNWGVRSYSLAAGLPAYRTVAKALKSEAAAADPWIILIKAHSRNAGATWRIRIPDRWSHLLTDPNHREHTARTRIEPVHSIFGMLRLAAAALLDAIGRIGAATSNRLANEVHTSPSHATRLLNRMAGGAYRLVAQDPATGHWHRTGRSLNAAAAEAGIDTLIATRRRQFALDREIWQELWDTPPKDTTPPLPPGTPPLWRPGWESDEPPEEGADPPPPDTN